MIGSFPQPQDRDSSDIAISRMLLKKMAANCQRRAQVKTEEIDKDALFQEQGR